MDSFPFAHAFESYQGQGGLHLTISAPVVVLDEYDSPSSPADVSIELNLALPLENPAEVSLFCRFVDQTTYTALQVDAAQWQLVQVSDGSVHVLAAAPANPAMQGGGWGWMRLGCLGDHLYVWDENGLQADLGGVAGGSGGTGLGFRSGLGAAGDVYLYFYRVMARE